MRTIAILLLLAVPALAQEDERIARLVQELGADDYKVREAAEAELKKIGAPAIPPLKKALEDKDAERAERARRVLTEIEKPKPEEKEKKAPRRSGIKSVYRDLARGLTVTVEDGKIEVVVPEEDKETGKKVYKTYKADSIEEFKEKYPEVAKKWDVEHVLPRFEFRPMEPGEFDKWWEEWKKRFDEDMKGLRDPLDRDFDQWFEEQRKLLDELRKRRFGEPPERRPVPSEGGEFGIKIEPVNETLAAQLELKEGEGVQVAEVKPGSLAEKSGLKKHDVVVKMNGKTVADKWEFRRDVRASLGKGFELEYFRAGKRETMKVKAQE
jgi:hypothetical protein